MGFIRDITTLFTDNQIEFHTLLECIGYAAGIKRVVRLCEKQDMALIIKDVCERHGLPVLCSRYGLKEAFSTGLSDTFYKITDINDPQCTRSVLFIGDAEWTEKAERVEGSGCDAMETAEMYSYPGCCAHNYRLIQQGQYWLDCFLTNATTGFEFSWKCNKIAYLFAPYLTIFPDYFPCSPSCSGTEKLASDYEEVLRDYRMVELLDLIRLHLQGLTLVAGGEVVYIKQFNQVGHDFIVEDNHDQLRLRYRKAEQNILPDRITRISLQGDLLVVSGPRDKVSQYQTAVSDNRILVFS